MNLPNKITTLRILLIIPLWIFCSFLNFYSILIATILGIIICVLDRVDGYLAIKYKLITDFGKIFDPIVDKIFMATAFTFFASVGMMPFSIVAIFLARMFIIGGIRILSATNKHIIQADFWGKIKTLFQNLTALFFALGLLHHLYVRDFQAVGIIDEEFMKAAVLNPLLYLTLAITVISLINYIYNNRNIFKDF